MADNIEPISHLEKVITGNAEPISHLEQIIALYGGTGGSGGSGTTNYNALLNKPSINGVELRGNKTLADLGITNYDDTQIKEDINEVDNKIEALKTSQSLEYEGESATCNNTLASRTSNMLIKGKTYINLGTGELESAGENENKISILSNNNKLVNNIDYRQDKKEVLLPINGGLKSLSNGVYDTIEQRTDGVYLVQKIGKYDIKENDEIKIDSPPNQNNTIAFLINVNANNIKTSGNNNICNNFNRFTSGDVYWNSDIEGVLNSKNSQFKFRILKSKLSTQNIDGIKAWLKANPTTICYEINTPIETKLNINNLDLEVYKDTTYVTTDNAIQPTLSFKVPSNIGGAVQANSQNINKLYKLSDEVDKKVDKTDITTTIDGSSTDSQVPSSKAVYDNTMTCGLHPNNSNFNIDTVNNCTATHVNPNAIGDLGTYPTEFDWGTFIHFPTKGYSAQVLISRKGIYYRIMNNGTWQSWYKVNATEVTDTTTFPKETT